MLVVLREYWSPLGDALECARATRQHAIESLRSIHSAAEKVMTSRWRVTESRDLIATTDKLIVMLSREMVSRPD